MSRYHFHVIDRTIAINLSVKELANYDAALECAEKLAVGLLRAEPNVYAGNPDAWEIKVTDDNGADVLSLPLSEVAERVR